MSVNSYAIIPNKFELYDLINIISKEADSPVEEYKHSDFNSSFNISNINFKFKGEDRMIYVVFPNINYEIDEGRKNFYLGDNISISLGCNDNGIMFLKKILKYTEGYLIESDSRDEKDPDYVKFYEREKDDFIIEKTPEEKLLTNLSIMNRSIKL